MPLMSLRRQRNHQPTPFQLKKKFGGGKSQKNAKGAAGGARPPSRRTGSTAQIIDFFGNGFGFQPKIAPNWIFPRLGRPLGRPFRWRRAAPATAFAGGRFEIAHAQAHGFLFARAAVAATLHVIVYNGKWNTNYSRLFLFENSNSRFAQISLTSLYSSEAAF